MRILFQGDSITDAGRDRSDPHHLGDGYPKLVAEKLREQYPDVDFEFLNFGISGNRTCDLVERWDTDCLDWQPDVVSILIGINDTWRRYDQNMPTTTEEYEANYRTILQQLKEKTNAKILMLEPFLLPVNSDWECWREDLDPKIHAARRLAREFADVYLPMDGWFAAACVATEPGSLSGDGVHPNEVGADFIADIYITAVEPYIK